MPAAEVPLNLPLETSKVIPAGNMPVSPSVGTGKPVTITVNVFAVPTVNLVREGLVIAGV